MTTNPRDVLGDALWRCYIIDPPQYPERMASEHYRLTYGCEPQHQVYDLGYLWLGPVPEQNRA